MMLEQTTWLEFALAYSMVGAMLAVLVSLLRWFLPHLATQPSTGHDVAVSARVTRLNALARGFEYVEYPLIALGTTVELLLLWNNAQNALLHTVLLGLYGALWAMLVLNWQKHTVSGRVVTPRQAPVANAVVRAVHSSNSRLRSTTTTDATGRFSMKVYPGSHQVTAGKIDHQSTETALTTLADRPPRISLVVTPAKPAERMTKTSKDEDTFPFAPLS